MPASSVGGDSVGNNAESDEQRPGQEWCEDGWHPVSCLWHPVELKQCSESVSLSPGCAVLSDLWPIL